MTGTVESATAKELAAMLSKRSTSYPCEIAVRMRNAARVLMAQQDSIVAGWIIRDALQYATQVDQVDRDPRCTAARVNWLRRVGKQLGSI